MKRATKTSRRDPRRVATQVLAGVLAPLMTGLFVIVGFVGFAYTAHALVNDIGLRLTFFIISVFTIPVPLLGLLAYRLWRVAINGPKREEGHQGPGPLALALLVLSLLGLAVALIEAARGGAAPIVTFAWLIYALAAAAPFRKRRASTAARGSELISHKEKHL